MKKGAGPHSRSADPCNNMQAVDSKRKRRADDDDDDDDGQILVKRMRSTEASVDAEHAIEKTRSGINTSGKRKADNDGEKPTKRARCDTTDPPETSPEVKKDTSQEQKPPSCTASLSRATFNQKYRKLEEIGSGGFGLVFAGVRRADGLPVAIKHIPIKKVLCEQVIRDGTHYNIYLEVAFMILAAGFPESAGQFAAVTLLDWYLLREEMILVMERPENAMDLYKYRATHGGYLDEDDAKMILRQLVDAAIDMDAKGVFHRDIKLRNVLIQTGSDGSKVRVIDFGCGAYATEKPFSSFRGTFKYAPPEWLQRGIYWARSTTVWQLGVLFYSLLAGHQSFTTREFMNKEIQINQELSGEVKALLEKCLAIDPEERASLEDLQRSLAH